MGKVCVSETSYKSWGKCIKITNGSIEALATVEIGPRIIRFGAVGGENMFFEDESGTVGNDDASIAEAFGSGEVWKIYGGHRLWHSPEVMPRTYLPENHPVKYEILENGVRLFPRELKEINTQNIMEITMSDDGEVTVLHTVINIGFWDIKLAPWAITVMAKGGLEVVPMTDRDTGYLSNRNLILWPYTKINDKCVKWHDRYVTVESIARADKDEAFKIGINNEDGYAMYFNKDSLFVKRFGYDGQAEYPDNGCNFETYTNDVFLECETLGGMKMLKPGERVEHTEKWSLFTGVKRPEGIEDIKSAVKKYIK